MVGVIMGLTPQQTVMYLDKYIYYEVFYNGKRYGFCSEYDKIEFEEKHPDKFVFKEFNFNYDDMLFAERLEKLMKLLEYDSEKIDEELKTKNICDIIS